MREEKPEQLVPSSAVRENLEGMARLKVPEWLRVFLEDEVTSLLGRGKSARIAAVEGSRL